MFTYLLSTIQSLRKLHDERLNLINRARKLKNEIRHLTSDSFKEQAILKYQHQLLNKLITALTSRNTPLRSTEQTLKDNWQQIRGTVLTYTARPADDLTILLCEVADFLSENQRTKEKKYPIQYLMPGVGIERLDNETNPLTTWPLTQILKTHITSNSAHTLIPVARLPELLETTPNQRFNHYFDYASMTGEDALISAHEMKRLIEHSTQTKDFYDKLQNYQLLCNEQGNLEL